MFFLLRCALAILLICIALEWRVGGPAATSQSKAPPKLADDKVVLKLQDQAAQAGAAIMRAGADAFARAARDKCAADPAECLAIARKLQAEGARRQ